MTLEPFNEYVIVLKSKVEDITHSGIILPHASEEDAAVWQGVVVESADGRFSKGDTILFNRFTPAEFEYNNDSLLALKAEDIIARLCK